MDLFNIVAILLTITALFAYFNHRYLGLPVTIGVMCISLVVSLLLNLLGPLGFPIEQSARLWLNSIDFNKTLLHGMLCFLLFAGALHININDLAKWKWSIGSLATVGTVVSTFLIGTITLSVSGWMGLDCPTCIACCLAP